MLRSLFDDIPIATEALLQRSRKTAILSDQLIVAASRRYVAISNYCVKENIPGDELQKWHIQYIGSIVQECEGRLEQREDMQWLFDRRKPLKVKSMIYKTVDRPTMLYGTEHWPMMNG